MKLWKLTTYLTVLILTFSGCVSTAPKPKQSAEVDSSLPVVSLTENGVYVDMQAVAFEWNSIKDPRVKGIYIYKKSLDSKDSEHKYHDTLKSRFVTHYVDSDVKPETTYSYYFKTFSKDSESQPSKESIVSTLPVLESVSWLHAIQDMPRSAKIIWRPHPNQIVHSYLLERKTLSTDSWDRLATIKGRLNAEYIDDELKDNHVYKYRIRVVTYNDMISKPSQELKVVTKALPKSIENISVTKDLPRKIKINWIPREMKDFVHFNLYRSEHIDKDYDLVTSTKNTEYIDEIDEDGKDYFYRVSIVDKDGLESKHDEKSVHGKTLSKPDTPSLVEVKMVGDNLHINWNSTDPRAKTFIVEKSVQRAWFKSAKEEFINIKGNTFVDTAIEPSTKYIYNVYSVDEFSIRSESSIDVVFRTTKDQGRTIEPKESKPAIDVKKAPVSGTDGNTVKPVEDFDMSEI